jgi:hypothetical protein
MKKFILAAIAGIALYAAPNTASAQLPYYGYYAVPYYPMPSYNSVSYYATPWGYRTYNTTGYNLTPFGWNAYNYGSSFVRPIITGPYHSVYIDGYGQGRWGTGYRNTPSFYQYYRFGY